MDDVTTNPVEWIGGGSGTVLARPWAEVVGRPWAGIAAPDARVDDALAVRHPVGFAVKRLIDVVGALLGLVVLSPLFVALGLVILVLDGRPILFRQERVGLGGRPFTVSKFRTMVPDAEARRAELGARNEIHGPGFKITEDPRLTRTGRFLRRSSLDELPQLWNVLNGEMSLVGPRPPLPSEVASYDGWHRRRLEVKPGITGLWQITARHEGDFDLWVRLDLAYIDRWSLWLDLRILARTVLVVLAFEGR